VEAIYLRTFIVQWKMAFNAATQKSARTTQEVMREGSTRKEATREGPMDKKAAGGGLQGNKRWGKVTGKQAMREGLGERK
jgi:hypothetical protein